MGHLVPFLRNQGPGYHHGINQAVFYVVLKIPVVIHEEKTEQILLGANQYNGIFPSLYILYRISVPAAFK